MSSQVALDSPSSEPATPAEGPLLVLPKRRSAANAKSSTKSHILNNRSSRDDRSSTSIDLSRSSIELEGLGIYTNLERDTRFQQNRGSVSNLHRSINHISSSPSITRLGQSYIHPRRQLPTGSTTPTGLAQRHSVDEGYFTTVNRSLTAIGSPSLSIPDDDDDSNSTAEETETPGRSSLDFSRHISPGILQRSQTDTVLSSGISSSWTPSEHLSSTELTSHAAAVRAARIAFAEKEATKARKIEEQQKKKAQQRDERRHQRSVSHITKLRPDAGNEWSEQQLQHRRTFSEAYQPRASLNNNTTTNNNNNDDGIAEEDFDSQEGGPTTMTAATMMANPPLAGSPKFPTATKQNWNRFLTWGKTRYYKAKRKVSMPVSTTTAGYR